MGDVDPSTQAGYRASMEDVVAYYSERFGVETPEFAVYIGPDKGTIRDVIRELGGSHAERFDFFGTIWKIRGTWVILVAVDFGDELLNATLLAHEYFHVLQWVLSDDTASVAPQWLVEGSATYEARLYGGLWELIHPRSIARAANHEGGLQDLESYERFTESLYGYSVGALANEWLAEHAGAKSQLRYWELLRRSSTWEDAFASAFGISPEDFYDAFDEDLGNSLSEISTGRVEGVVLGPDGEALQGIGLTLLGPGSSWNTVTSRVGTFGLRTLDGAYAIHLSVRIPGDYWIWRHVGWYGGATGFTTDRALATIIEVAGTDVTGLEIHLPALPADLPTIE